MANVGSLKVKIDSDTRGLQRGLARSKTQIGGFARTATKAFAGITAAIGTMGAAAMSIKAINLGAEFSKQMATVAGITKATGEQFEEMTDLAKKLGRTTEFTAKQAASGLQFLGMAGFSAADGMKALPGVLDLATAGNIDLGRAADIASNALTAMQLPVEQLGRVNDVFVETITSSNTNMEMMAESFRYAAPLAAGFGVSIEELSSMIGILGNAGIQGSMAGTQLAMAFQKAGEVMDDTGKPARSLVDAIEILNKRGATAGEIMEIFGNRAGRAVLALRSQGADAIRDFTNQLEEAEGATKSLADTMRDNLKGDIDALKSAIQGMALEVVGEDMGMLRGIVQSTTEAVRALTPKLAKMAEGLQEVATDASTTVKALGRTKNAISDITTRMVEGQEQQSKFFQGFVTGAEKAFVAIERVRKPWMLFTDALGVASDALGPTVEKFETLEGLMPQFTADLESAVKNGRDLDAVYKEWSPTIDMAIASLREMGIVGRNEAQGLRKEIEATMGAMKAQARLVRGALIGELVPSFKEAMVEVAESGKDLTTAFEEWKPTINHALKKLRELGPEGKRLAQIMEGEVQNAFDSVKKSATDLWMEAMLANNAMADSFDSMSSSMSSMMQQFNAEVNKAKAMGTGLTEVYAKWAPTLEDALYTMGRMGGVSSDIFTSVEQAFTKAQAGAKKIKEEIRETTETTKNAVQETGSAIESIPDPEIDGSQARQELKSITGAARHTKSNVSDMFALVQRQAWLVGQQAGTAPAWMHGLRQSQRAESAALGSYLDRILSDNRRNEIGGNNGQVVVNIGPITTDSPEDMHRWMGQIAASIRRGSSPINEAVESLLH